jgi:hypothetical protein
MKLTNETCSMFKQPCRHCSNEVTIRPFTRVEKDPRTGLFRPLGQEKKRIPLGDFCNDAGKFVKDMHFCPIRWDSARKGTRRK